ncbi:DUF5996 family protein [Sphingomonas sp. SUN019]|uniref:DUF5996 family protein n=1 Tax=Sphingomonas sp. SUN019 TaxID=2937788 RepID=UPI00216428FD|nr:DUF5996 family protein [Sphingomonas sp. SUN019]UVO49908.1 DUF5996 family protein [Sphingomonas sp. SUN019]
MTRHPEHWPALDYASWADTLATLHLWTQMVGKVRLAHEPWLNHSWHVPLYVSARGLTTSLVNGAGTPFEIEFDFAESHLLLRTADGGRGGFALEPMSVAAFHANLISELRAIGLDSSFDGRPNEIAGAVPFAEDVSHAAYDAAEVRRWWRAILSIERVFKRFRTGFTGKASPVHFFWGSFDLAVTRFSGRKAPLHPGGVPELPDAVAREAYDREVSSAGFWPGDAQNPQAAFYSYAYPAPDGFGEADVRPGEARFSKELGEWLLPYDAVRSAEHPEEALMRFLEDSFEAAAGLAGWDRDQQCELGRPRRPRASTARSG